MSISVPTAFKVKVKILYGELQPIIDWCDRNFIGEWRWMEDPTSNPTGTMYDNWVFFFENERDYIAFLIWKN